MNLRALTVILFCYASGFFVGRDTCNIINSNETSLEKVLRTGTRVCNGDYHCIKPINIKGSHIRALEIVIHGNKKASIITCDKDGKPADLNKGFILELRATKIPAVIDAVILPRKVK